MANDEVFQPMLRTVRTLWGAMLASTVVMTVLSVVLDNHRAKAPPNYGLIFSVLAVASAVVSFVLPARIAAQAGPGGEVERVPGRPLAGSTQPTVTFANPAAAAKRAFGHAFTPFILSIALSEAVCLYGLALHLVGGPVSASLPIALFGVALVAVRFPTAARMVGPFEKAQGATFEVGA